MRPTQDRAAELRACHDRVLGSGAIPLDVPQGRIRRRIAPTPAAAAPVSQ
ncbi:MAG TPA: hypothetical protein VF851_07930 [Steroidobacteraceae bacterium]